MPTVSQTLRRWFLIHFVLDFLFGLPLLFFPAFTLSLFGFLTENLMLARLVGAALIGIGGTSLLMHRAGIEIYKAMLDLKIFWSISAIIAIILSIMTGAPPSAWLFLAIFGLFSVVWTRYRFLVK